MTSNAGPFLLLAAEACRRYPDLASNAIARYLAHQHPAVYANPEQARTAVRKVRGAHGAEHRLMVRAEHRVARAVPEQPASEMRVPSDYALTDGIWGIMADIHVPFHDRAAVERCVKDFRARGVNRVLINGDLQDCEAVGYFVTIGRNRNFVREVEVTVDFLDWLRGSLPKAQIVWLPGNHEERHEIAYASAAPQLAGLPTASMAEILRLDSRGIALLDRRQRAVARAKTRWGDLTILHGHTVMRGRASPVSPARTLMLACKANAVIGHCHRSTYQPERTISRRPIACWSVGCLCGLDPDYNPDASNWDHGHAILTVQRGDWEMVLRRHLPDGRIV